jgi:hypothetical protein
MASPGQVIEWALRICSGTNVYGTMTILLFRPLLSTLSIKETFPTVLYPSSHTAFLMPVLCESILQVCQESIKRWVMRFSLSEYLSTSIASYLYMALCVDATCLYLTSLTSSTPE